MEIFCHVFFELILLQKIAKMPKMGLFLWVKSQKKGKKKQAVFLWVPEVKEGYWRSKKVL